jgi:hypothetical protein
MLAFVNQVSSIKEQGDFSLVHDGPALISGDFSAEAAAFSIVIAGDVVALGGSVEIFGAGAGELVFRILAGVLMCGGKAIASGVIGERR